MCLTIPLPRDGYVNTPTLRYLEAYTLPLRTILLPELTKAAHLPLLPRIIIQLL